MITRNGPTIRKRAYAWLTGAVLLLCTASSPAGAETPWGASYFPNVPLTTHDGEVVHFFDDLVKDKIVVINFIYTTCPDTCPLETAHLVRVQRLLADRLGKDIFFYSISIDPDHDTPEVLAKYREQFGARWTFLTGDEDDVVLLRKKLGLYAPEIQDDTNNHNVNMIIGNQATGRWMKRGPFENPHVLADQIGNWLDGWKSPQRGDDYANAPKLRSVPRGEHIFRTRCSPCHTMTGKELPDALGPDLEGVTKRREHAWLVEWLRAPDQMLAKKDPIAVGLYARYNELAMPNMRLNQEEALDVLSYLDEASDSAKRAASAGTAQARESAADVLAVVDAWVREPRPGASVNAGYMTLVNAGRDEVELVGVESEAFESIDLHEMTSVDGLMEMRDVPELPIAAGGHVQLAPGGMHLMMRGPRRELVAGGEVELTLVFASGEKQAFRAPVSTR